MLLSWLQGPLFCETREGLQLQPLKKHLVSFPDHLGGWPRAEHPLSGTLLASQYFYPWLKKPRLFWSNQRKNVVWNHSPWLAVIVLPVLLSVWTWASHLIFPSLSVLLGKIKITVIPTSQLLRWPNEMINVNKLHKLLSSRSAFPKVCSMGRRLVSSDALWEKKKRGFMVKSPCMMRAHSFLESLHAQ